MLQNQGCCCYFFAGVIIGSLLQGMEYESRTVGHEFFPAMTKNNALFCVKKCQFRRMPLLKIATVIWKSYIYKSPRYVKLPGTYNWVKVRAFYRWSRGRIASGRQRMEALYQVIGKIQADKTFMERVSILLKKCDQPHQVYRLFRLTKSRLGWQEDENGNILVKGEHQVILSIEFEMHQLFYAYSLSQPVKKSMIRELNRVNLNTG